MPVKRIYGGVIVAPSNIFEGTITIENEHIVSVEKGTLLFPKDEDINAKGMWIVPGFIDSHSDAIETELQPRPTSSFPIELSFYELEKKLVSEGITTIYHSLSLQGDQAKHSIRQNEIVLSTIHGIKACARTKYLINHRVHLRFEISNIDAIGMVEQLLENRIIDQLSFMDHTPGQGQYRDIELHKRFLMEHRNMSEKDVERLFAEKSNRLKVNEQTLQRLADLAKKQRIPLASHDDDSIEKIALVKEWGADISEFPVALNVAIAAKKAELHVVMGAPNVLLERSHSNNLSALEAIEQGVVDILCSDYYPSSLLHAVFKLYKKGFALHDVINMVSLNPAKALGLDGEVGSIEAGKRADLLLIREHNNQPFIEKVMANGHWVCTMNYQPKPSKVAN